MQERGEIMNRLVRWLFKGSLAIEHFQTLHRHDPCWCGSGKKYERCHRDQDEKIYHKAINQKGPGNIKRGDIASANKGYRGNYLLYQQADNFGKIDLVHLVLFLIEICLVVAAVLLLVSGEPLGLYLAVVAVVGALLLLKLQKHINLKNNRKERLKTKAQLMKASKKQVKNNQK